MTEFTEAARGVYVIAPTPFTKDGAVDMESTDRMVDFFLERGADGLTVLGMMGEAPKLTLEESRAFVQRILERVKERVPVIVGVSAPGFAQMGALSEMVMGDGATGVMVAPPSSLRSDDQILGYYRQVAETLGDATPFVLQDFPLVTNVVVPVPVILNIVKELPSCVCLKHEDWPGLAKIAALRAASDGGARRISILCGNGGLFLPEELARGADGAMTGFAYPEMMIEVCRLHTAGEEQRARDVFDAYLPLARYEQQPGLGLALRKYTLAKRGIIAEPKLRRPGPSLSAADIADLESLIARQTARLNEIA
ncbi:dihydrodipicolinate synthase family protein [Pelagibius litoralis]|uniref:Dihydrodipicolinate synthase family protein n=1 Tax=Pelagibius litoralis TaxID=374515 RepID=A0A967C3H6_9PROT|nr:dihydrodipicolinate synthase family protein [Pelagibius litoralis]NIA67840.1 dihydrodipicolinate synthase family protein [Pelagibius litoralis]